VEDDAASDFIYKNSNQLLSNAEWVILRHFIAKLALCSNFFSYYHAGDSHGGACL